MVKDKKQIFNSRTALLTYFSSLDYDFSIPRVEYDDIVDTSNFKLSSEKIRDKIATGNVGAGEQGLYDFKEDEKVTHKNCPTDVEIALRNGKLDKADIQKLQDVYSDKAKDDVETERTKSALEAERKASKNRDKAVDDILGVNQTLEDSKV